MLDGTLTEKDRVRDALRSDDGGLAGDEIKRCLDSADANLRHFSAKPEFGYNYEPVTDIRSEITGFMLDKRISLSAYDELEGCHFGCGPGCLKNCCYDKSEACQNPWSTHRFRRLQTRIGGRGSAMKYQVISHKLSAKTDAYAEGVLRGIARLNESLDPGNSGIEPIACIAHIEAGTGDPYNCRGTLYTYATIKALLAWFEERDLSALKQWSFVAGKLRRAMYQMRPNGVYYTPVYLMPLLSDAPSLIDWFGNFEYPFSSESGSPASTRLNNPRMDEYYHYNTWLALRGDWKKLAERSRAFLNDVPAKQSAYQADSRFHLALSEGDVAGMESALAELLEPKLMRRRQQEEGGYSQHFICTIAIVYAKIAWRHGFQVQVDSPWVPQEWLPIVPLPKYEVAFAFMAESDESMPMPHG